MDGASGRHAFTMGDWWDLKRRDSTEAALLALATIGRALHRYGLASFDADDARSNALDRLWSTPPAQPHRAFDGWTNSVVRSAVRDHRRQLLRSLPPGGLDPVRQLPCPSTEPPGKGCESEESHAALLGRVVRAIEALPRPHGSIVRWQFLDGLSRAEIGRRLQGWGGVSAPRCHRLLAEARALLREALAGSELSQRRPRLFSEKNRWNSIPPPNPDAYIEGDGDESP